VYERQESLRFRFCALDVTDATTRFLRNVHRERQSQVQN
jgi:hypothetical protein